MPIGVAMPNEIPKEHRDIIAGLITKLEPQLVGFELRLVLIVLAHLMSTGLAELGPEDAEQTFAALVPMIQSRMLNILEDMEQASTKPPGVTLQ
jgi:hypothetical protein